MICADLHVHSMASKRPSEWFLKKVGARESYTDVEAIYQKAKDQGMTFVTVSDHNTIEGGLNLVKAHPDDTFLSVEVTAYFPEDNCKIHILVFDLTRDQFKAIDGIRNNIYLLRDYLLKENLAYSVAHATYSVNNRLTLAVLEKLMVLFDVFEGINGARNSLHNEVWQAVLHSLTPDRMEVLADRYSIEPAGSDPWIKGITGGSDDHAGLFIGQTYTTAPWGITRADFINSIREKRTFSSGRSNDYKSLAFSIYKIFCDYSGSRFMNDPHSIQEFVGSILFSDSDRRVKNWIIRQKIKRGKEARDQIIFRFFDDVLSWSRNRTMDVEARMEKIYTSMATLFDGFTFMVMESMVKDLCNGDAGRLFKNISASLPMMFISVPFFSSLKHLFLDRDLITALKHEYVGPGSHGQDRVLWFTDTINDLNGVAVSLSNYMQSALDRDCNATFVVCLPDDKARDLLPNTLNLNSIFCHSPDFYASYTLHIPSLLNSVEQIYKQRPERIIISTPGPVGLLGLLMSKLMGVPVSGIFHTDFAAQAGFMFDDEIVADVINEYTRWFYACVDEIRVPTRAYMEILESQGYDHCKMRLLKRGIDIRPPRFSDMEKRAFMGLHKIPRGFTLLWAGRVSRDKNLYFLVDIYRQVAAARSDVNLVICGDGPDLGEVKQLLQGFERVVFTGCIPHGRMLEFYTCADLFVFPSTTDTFGMVVFEAQACGLAAMVSDVGGPQEIVVNGKTGFVRQTKDSSAWSRQILELVKLKQNNPQAFDRMGMHAAEHIRVNFSWDEALGDILEGEQPEVRPLEAYPPLQVPRQSETARAVA
ncbi:putative glycosyl transferase, group 1 family protein [Desulforapulum autotrophicum HRM2]|uniref:Glycosyl transferase, group 1 family protein n=1 Tax=Desulforapulum autotrophicum (strain ATCC 43914 / DSM 3382 / VKM B-1955 / HRM2) TaxID=177437 RepID=C0QFA8_DESAH|nr:glycosyltransferase [Desulforapulum autotrophicum]ACN13304.1 putative glycosyl transferase, group 1 family protein [Desulforapulum autotrophicum HRM2]